MAALCEACFGGLGERGPKRKQPQVQGRRWLGCTVENSVVSFGWVARNCHRVGQQRRLHPHRQWGRSPGGVSGKAVGGLRGAEGPVQERGGRWAGGGGQEPDPGSAVHPLTWDGSEEPGTEQPLPLWAPPGSGAVRVGAAQSTGHSSFAGDVIKSVL